ncbi:MAG: hypothetical protein SAJ72_14975 [Jaaginema sp. PMC 1080.18]|nr:hypothetical protein [Jaaginema sp. PMC 1080.18]
MPNTLKKTEMDTGLYTAQIIFSINFEYLCLILLRLCRITCDRQTKLHNTIP